MNVLVIIFSIIAKTYNKLKVEIAIVNSLYDFRDSNHDQRICLKKSCDDLHRTGNQNIDC